MIIRGKRQVELNGLKLTVDLDKANTPAARFALYKNDRHGDPFGLLTFLEYALGAEQLEMVIRSVEHDGEPGTDADFIAVIQEIFKQLGPDGKK